jgi:multicomponent Na+:H+ antiporter subunit E
MRRRLFGRLPMLVWLALVWVLLWGSLKPLVVLSALVVAPLCLAACRLPVVPMSRRPRLGAVPGAALRFARDLVTSSAEVAWTTIRRGPRTKSAIVAVPVGPASDSALTSVAHRLSLEPGTLVLDIDRERNVLYLYVLDVEGTENIGRARRSAKRHAADLLRAEGFDPATTADEEER